MKLLIVDSKISEKCERSLLKEGYTLLKLPADKDLGEAVCSHPDTLLFYHDGELISTADYCDCAPYIFSDIRELCPNVKIHFTADKRGAKYPLDCILNALVVGDRIFCKSDSVSSAIIELAERKNYKICHTNQGYPACSALAYGDKVITADRGLASALTKQGVKVTLISEGVISLPPHDYGFIGGASGVVGNKVYFFGDIMSHPDGELICKLILDDGYLPISLSDEPLRDFGGIISL